MLASSDSDAPTVPASEPPATDLELAPATTAPRVSDRIASLLEVLACSGLSQLLLGQVLLAVGVHPLDAHGQLSLPFVVAVTLADSAVLVGLVLFFLRLRGEQPRDVLLGHRNGWREALHGILLLPVVFLALGVLALAVQHLAPWLHNVPDNPLAALLGSPGALAIVALVVVVGGGIREEVQRAFVLHRFEQHLGGPWVGLVVFSTLFGLGHALQGWDVTIMTGSLGLIWGLTWLRRRSVIAPVVCHSLFNLIEVAWFGFQG